MKFGRLIAIFCGFLGFATVTGAMDLPELTGDPLLTISGESLGLGAGEKIQLDLAGLEKMGETEVLTSTIWTKGTQSFVGLSLATLVDALGVEQGSIMVSAINDYGVEVPVSDAVDKGPIIAYRMNGKEMSIRDKGPLWLIYPYDSNPSYRTEVIYSRSVWQLDRMTFSD